jgi:predicted 5'-methylthioadenosine/S-adenosylhomocysteine nucleosidase
LREQPGRDRGTALDARHAAQNEQRSGDDSAAHGSILAYRYGVSLLVVAALHEEVAHLPAGIDVLVTGVGKTRAATALSHRLAVGRLPDAVVNLGTAGAVDGVIGGLVEVGWVTQHDFPYEAIEGLTARPVERGYVLEAVAPPRPLAKAPAGVLALATGDMFVSDAAHARRLSAQGIHLVDMEAFALAAACAAFGVPMRCVKVVSDAADETAGESWLDTIDHCARTLGTWLEAAVR